MCSSTTLAMLLLAVASSAQAPSGDTPQVLVRGTHREVTFERDVSRVAVGDDEVMSSEVLDSRSVLLLGRTNGRTSLIVWFADGEREQMVFAVQPDLGVLRTALGEIHPSITAEMAPDRDALVLRGLVPDTTYARTAEAAARSYLGAGSTPSPILVGRRGGAGERARSGSGDAGRMGAVINLIRLERAPALADERMRAAIAPLTSDVIVRRVQRGPLIDDTQDVFLLEGSVADQVVLGRVLHVAAAVLLGSGAEVEIEVLADEAGALVRDQVQRGDESEACSAPPARAPARSAATRSRTSARA